MTCYPALVTVHHGCEETKVGRGFLRCRRYDLVRTDILLHVTFNHGVAGSSPAGLTRSLYLSA